MVLCAALACPERVESALGTSPAVPSAPPRVSAAPSSAAPSTAHAAPAKGAPRGFLYRIERAGVPPSWLFGTLHSGEPRVVAVAGAPMVSRALAAARTLAVEMQSGPGDDAQLYAGAELPEGERLDALVDAGTMRGVLRSLDGTVQPGRVVRLKPWAVLLKLAEAPGPGALPLDAVLREHARERRMTLLGLELPEEQVAAFDSVPVQSQVALLRYALEHRFEMAADNARAVDAWLAGDAAALARATRAPLDRHPDLAPHFAALERSIVTGRSALFAHRLFVPLRAGRVFVAVGASHLHGSGGLIALIEAQGYRVRAVP